MKKKNLFTLALGVFALSLGITSCQKDKNSTIKKGKDDPKGGKGNCAIVTYMEDGKEESDCFCVGDDGMTQDQFDRYVSYYKNLSGYTVKLVEKCR